MSPMMERINSNCGDLAAYLAAAALAILIVFGPVIF